MKLTSLRESYQAPECSFSTMTEETILCASFNSPEVTEVTGDFVWE